MEPSNDARPVVGRRLARLGDFAVCHCKLPVPYTIKVHAITYEAVAELNGDLLSDSPIWELVPPNAQVKGAALPKAETSALEPLVGREGGK